jgi:hypothetical protein
MAQVMLAITFSQAILPTILSMVAMGMIPSMVVQESIP